MALPWVLLLSFVATLTTFARGDPVQLWVSSKEAVSRTERTFASWNIDSSCNRGFHHINFTNPNLLAAARALWPSRLRFGGSGNDYLVYGLSPGSPECSTVHSHKKACSYFTPGCLNASHWCDLHDLALKSGADLIFGVSYGLDKACQEGAVYRWNATNAALLLQHIRSTGQRVWGFELGNEINNAGAAPCNQSARQQVYALQTFSKMVRAELPSAVLIGPDTGFRAWQDWLDEYLSLLSANASVIGRLHAVTHHVYRGISRKNFNDPGALDGGIPEITWYTEHVGKLVPGAQVWAGENGPAAGGDDGTCGKNSICGTYASAMWYADELGLRSRFGFVQHQRQDFIGGHYGLVDSPDSRRALSATQPLILRPDFWINFMWKRTIGTNVLNITTSSKMVRAYAFSGNPPSHFSASQCSAGDVLQLLLVNLGDVDAVEARLPARSTQRYSAWTMTPASLSPFSTGIRLNDAELPDVVDASDSDPSTFLRQIPQFAVHRLAGSGIVLPPLSISFVCLGRAASLEGDEAELVV